jgi:hypothetical protein
MTRVTAVLITGLCGVLAVALPAASARRAPRPTCASLARGAQRLALTLEGRVYRRDSTTRTGSDRMTYYGCLNARPAARTLLTTTESASPNVVDDVSAVRAAGRFVVLALYEGTATVGNKPTLVLIDLSRPGRTAIDPLAPDSASFVNVTDLALNYRGQLAWIARASAGSLGGGPGSLVSIDVRARDATGSRLLDRGDDVEPGSLDIGSRSVTWRRAGVLKAAALS